MTNAFQQLLDDELKKDFGRKPDYDKAIQIIETFHKHQEEKQALIGNDTFIVRFNTGNKDKESTAFEKFLASIGAREPIVSLVKDERGHPVDVNTLRTKKLESELAELKGQVAKLQAKPKKKKRS